MRFHRNFGDVVDIQSQTRELVINNLKYAIDVYKTDYLQYFTLKSEKDLLDYRSRKLQEELTAFKTMVSLTKRDTWPPYTGMIDPSQAGHKYESGGNIEFKIQSLPQYSNFRWYISDPFGGTNNYRTDKESFDATKSFLFEVLEKIKPAQALNPTEIRHYFVNTFQNVNRNPSPGYYLTLSGNSFYFRAATMGELFGVVFNVEKIVGYMVQALEMEHKLQEVKIKLTNIEPKIANERAKLQVVLAEAQAIIPELPSLDAIEERLEKGINPLLELEPPPEPPVVIPDVVAVQEPSIEITTEPKSSLMPMILGAVTLALTMFGDKK